MRWRFRSDPVTGKKWKRPLAANSEEHRTAVRSENSIFWIGRQLCSNGRSVFDRHRR
jgi:hypothetical protein